MAFIRLEELKNILKENEVSIVHVKNNNDLIEISKRISIYFDINNLQDEKNGQLINNGYQIMFNENFYNYENLESVLEFFKLDSDKTIELIKINNRFSSFHEFLEDRAFNELDMKGILNKYENEADSFELVCPYIKEFCDKHEINFTFVDVENAVNELEEKIMSRLKKSYETHCEDVECLKNKSFESIMNEIKEESFLLLEKAENKGRMLFLCDNVYKRKTKYHTPENFFWHAYHSVQQLFDCKKHVEQFKTNSLNKLSAFKCDLSDFEILKPFLISKRLSYSWHCTETSFFAIVFKFKLNQETKKYLLNFKSDYDLSGLEDLALYKGDKILFSSCTHEQFHRNCIKN